MKYYKAEFNVEYDREWFEPEGDEIIIMQQHCGGENLTVFKSFVHYDSNSKKKHIDRRFQSMSTLKTFFYFRNVRIRITST